MSELQAQVSRDAQRRRKDMQETLELQRQVAEAQAARDSVQKEVGKLFVPLRGNTEFWDQDKAHGDTYGGGGRQ